jgi:hypothetical protein
MKNRNEDNVESTILQVFSKLFLKNYCKIKASGKIKIFKPLINCYLQITV